MISTVLTSLSQVTAITAIIVYAVSTFQKFGTFKNPYTPSIILATTLIFGSLTSSYLADKLGRKLLNCLSLMLTAVGLLITALFYYLNLNGHSLSAYSWIPVCSLSFAIFVSSAGITALGLICSVENLPPKVFFGNSFDSQFWTISYHLILLFVSDSYKWNGNSLFFTESHNIYMLKNVFNPSWTRRFARLLNNLCRRLYFGLLFCFVRSRWDGWQITWRRWHR